LGNLIKDGRVEGVMVVEHFSLKVGWGVKIDMFSFLLMATLPSGIFIAIMTDFS
jgi:hypothetical protein